jgi:hydroxymethylpyrimidine pyrophosphatase-like HAD family hydrolase
LNNQSGKSIKCQRIYAEFVGKVIHTTKQFYAHAYHYTTHHEPFFQQVINLEEKEVRRFIFNITTMYRANLKLIEIF